MSRASAKRRAEVHPGRESSTFDKTLRVLSSSGRHQLWRVFSDFVELAALSFSNVVLVDPEREARYLKILDAYEPDEQVLFPELLALVVLAQTNEPQDFLGAAFMRLELGSHWHGQFFTPWEVCRLMASVTIGDEAALRALIAGKGYVSVLEPASGAGAMVLALAEAIRALGFNPQRQLSVEAWDLDATAARMAYVQCAVVGLPAKVVIGNSLSLEVRETLFTPQWHLGFWSARKSFAHEGPSVEAGAVPEAAPETESAAAVPALPSPPEASKKAAGQLALW